MQIYKLLKKTIIPAIFVSASLLIVAFSRSSFNEKRAKNVYFIESAKTQQDQVISASLIAPKRPLPLYGFNGNNIKGPQWSTPGLSDSIKALKMEIIRYPGGNIGDWWDWKKGWFISNNNLPIQYRSVKKINATLSDLKQLLKDNNCDVIFTLNMVTSSIDDQISMLKYADSIGIPIKWIELGNEYNVMNSDGIKKYKTPIVYGDECNKWIAEIKTVFPNAKIGVIGGNKTWAKSVQNWNKEVLQTSPTADAIVAHLYPYPEKILTNSMEMDFKKLYEIYKHDFLIQGFDKVSKDKSIWITEYNILWNASKRFKNPSLIKQAKDISQTWSQALSTVLLTSESTELSSKVNMIINHNLTGIPTFSAIETQNKTFRKLPNGIGMESWLAAANSKDYIQKISFFSGTKEMMQYEIFGWSFYSGKKRSLIVVNLTDQAISINFNNIAALGSTAVIKYAEKNKIILNYNDIEEKRAKLQTNILQLPAYSITNIDE